MSDQSSSAADRLRELTDLHTQGVISDAEYDELRLPLLKELGWTDEVPSAPTGLEAERLAEESDEHVDAPTSGPPRSRDTLLVVGLTLGLGLLVAMAAIWVNYDRINDWLNPPEQEAYDTGFGKATSPFLKYLTPGGYPTDIDPELSSLLESVGGLDALPCDGLAEARFNGRSDAFEAEINQLDQWIIDDEREMRLYRGAWGPEDAGYYRDGFWDAVIETCPNVFVDPRSVFAERPFPREHPRP